MLKRRWEHFEHGADIGVRGFGPTLAAAFEEAALALVAIVADPRHVAATLQIEIRCDAPDREILFLDWLNALIFEMATRRMLFARFSVHLDDRTLSASAAGEPVDIDRHSPAVELKGATFTELRVSPFSDGWMAQCIVDV
jgi:SHS2 domain-containing protein